VVIFSCTNQRKKGENVTTEAISPKAPLDNRKLINELLDKAVNKGDAKAYNQVASYHITEDMGQEFLYYALKVSNKYNNPEAYFHVYYILAFPRSGEKLKDMDKRTQNMAMYYLMKSFEMGHTSAKFQVEEIFKNEKIIPKSSYYLKKLSEDYVLLQ
jgi:hypothetical protein